MSAGLVLLPEEQYPRTIDDDHACCTPCLIISLGGCHPWSYCSMNHYWLAALHTDMSVVVLRL